MNAEPIKFVVKYETTSALYAGQTIVNAVGDEVIVDFSSGPIPGQGEQVLPIHTRIALSSESASRLARLLLQATNRQSDDEARLPGS
ncbi:hypothetical protein ACYFX5_25030 [Bremerella sp. T1]|uniref:hypothetical protein n=1 Tax=Bremerella sp. TYQ1 TaxID=3119568 RepID=UPI001CCD5CAF|nr:hypothetical protein [Bremerella volcania]UBM36282.1 hypothetical protein LA756_26965 [Bremerella volcania]